jgi:hypothetical protein
MMIPVFIKKYSLCLMFISLISGTACIPVFPGSKISSPIVPPPVVPQSAVSSENNLPIIHNLVADKTVRVLSTCEIVCKADSPDGSKLTFTWSAKQGVIQGSGDRVKWTAPAAPDTCTINVTVKDQRGGEATKAVSIVVTDAPNKPPVIVRFNIKVQEPKTDVIIDPKIPVIERKTPVVKTARPVDIECISEDADGDRLTYTWEVPAGRVSGEGNKITWMAPDEPMRYIIKITVTDPSGSSNTAVLAFDIKCCV